MFFKSITRWRFFWWNIVWVKLTSYMLLGSTRLTVGLPCSSDGKESTCNARDPGSIPGSGRSSGGSHYNPLQYSCLKNPHGPRSLASYIQSMGSPRVGHNWATKHNISKALFRDQGHGISKYAIRLPYHSLELIGKGLLGSAENNTLSQWWST